MKYTQINIDNETLYVANVSTSGRDAIFNRNLSEESLKKSFAPVIKFGKSLKEGMQDLTPDEIEIAMQLSLSIENNNLIFALVNTAAEAQLSVKYVWKK